MMNSDTSCNLAMPAITEGSSNRDDIGFDGKMNPMVGLSPTAALRILPNVDKFLQILQHNMLPINVRCLTQLNNTPKKKTDAAELSIENAGHILLHQEVLKSSSSSTVETASDLPNDNTCLKGCNSNNYQSSNLWEPMPINLTDSDKISDISNQMIPAMESISNMFDEEDVSRPSAANDQQSLQRDEQRLSGFTHPNTNQFPLGSVFAPIAARATQRFKPFQLEKWMERVEELKAFRKINGHCMVPHTYPPNQQLSRWCKRQRRQYKLLRAGKPSTMTPNRAAFLEDMGFIWDRHEAVWNEKIQDLALYKKTHGHTFVPSNYKANPQLGVW